MSDILDHGYVRLVETWGSDERIVEAARMSTGGGWQWRPVGIDTAFAPPFSTIRVCRGCGCLVAGGPTACNRCAESPTGGV